MTDLPHLPPPSGPRFPGAAPLGAGPARPDDDVFAARGGSFAPPKGPAVRIAYPPPAASGRLATGYPASADSTAAYLASAPKSFGVQAGAPGVAILDVPGALEQVTLQGLNGPDPAIYVGMRKLRAKSFTSGLIAVPAAGGGTIPVKMSMGVPGFPKVTSQGRVLYEEPKPAFGDRVVIVLTFVLTILGLGVIIGYFVGKALLHWVVPTVKRGGSIMERRVLPLLAGFGIFALGVVMAVVYVSGSAANPR